MVKTAQEARGGQVVRAIKRVFAVLYLLAGAAKASPRIEDVAAELRQAAEANQGTALAAVSLHLADHARPVTVLVGVAMVLFGVSLWRDWLLLPAAIGQIAMLACFMAVLHRAFPMVLLVDLPFLAVALLVVRQATRVTDRQAALAGEVRQQVGRRPP